MEVHRRIPRPPLDQFVEALWLYKSSKSAHAIERALPDGCAQLIVNLREDEMRLYDRWSFHLTQKLNGALLVGPQTEFCVIDTAGLTDVAGVHFKPGGAYPFFRPPMQEMHASHVPLDALWGRFAGELRERLLAARTPQQRLFLMEQMLLAQAGKRLERHPAVHFALGQFQTAPHATTIAEITQQTGFSARHFIEMFRREVGMTPKLFCRVHRFQRTLKSIAAGKPISWSAVALESGYFDQAHFIHDFHAFSGVSPSAYRETRPVHPNHVPIRE